MILYNNILLYDICYYILYNVIYTCYIITHFDEIFLYNIKYNWSILCSKSISRNIAIHITSLSLIARGLKQIISVIAITSKPVTRDPIVTNAKTWDRVPAGPIRFRVLVALIPFSTLINNVEKFHEI